MKVQQFFALIFVLGMVLLGPGVLAQQDIAPDDDLDGLSNADEINIYGTDPRLADSDFDAMVDGVEIHVYGTDPLLSDAAFTGDIPIGTGTLTQLTIAASSDMNMSGNGQVVAIASFRPEGQDSKITAYDRLSGVTDHIFDAFDFHPKILISNDGRYVAFTAYTPADECLKEWTAYLYDRHDDTLTEVMSGVGVEDVFAMALSGDGSTLFLNWIQRSACSGGEVVDVEIYAYDVLTSNLTALTVGDDLGLPSSDVVYIEDISASDDGQRLAVTLFNRSNVEYEAYLVDVPSNNTTQIAIPNGSAGANHATISGDGSTIVLPVNTSTNDSNVYESEIYIHDTMSNTDEVLNFGTPVSSIVLQSGDGNVFAFNGPTYADNQSRYTFVYNRQLNSLITLPLPSNIEASLLLDLSTDGTQVFHTLSNCALAPYNTGAATGTCNNGTPYWFGYYVYENGAPPTVQTNLPMGQATITEAGEWFNLEWQHLDRAQWYHVWVGDYGDYEFGQWVEASEVCVEGVCTLSDDLWLSNGDFHWWMGYWSPGYPHHTHTYAETSFSVDVPAPATTLSMVTPESESTLNTGPSQLVWERDPNALWYQLWVGPATYSTTTFFDWVDATEVCAEGSCTLDLSGASMPDGDYEVWVEVWGPGGYHTWTAMADTPATFRVSGE